MNIFKKAKEAVTTSVIKNQVKGTVNDKLNLDGKFDDQIDRMSEEMINRVGTNNIVKAKKVFDILKK
ncbi:hypothetical protein [Vibrio crassostreae]|uniref:hypothetical protein n=1 Tax=Vibrio crassostreae TaxID=246167 RepID=UPI001B308EB4|nr:hypothetical protein [Vibrio crassostreae]